MWLIISNHHYDTKISQKVKEALYNWIIHHPQSVHSQIKKYCPYVSIDGNSQKQLMPNVLFHFSVQELHNILVIPPEEVGLK